MCPNWQFARAHKESQREAGEFPKDAAANRSPKRLDNFLPTRRLLTCRNIRALRRTLKGVSLLSPTQRISNSSVRR